MRCRLHFFGSTCVEVAAIPTIDGLADACAACNAINATKANQCLQSGFCVATGMNNVSGFGLLRYDGTEWTVEFSDGGPARLANPKNVSARGMTAYQGYVYLGVHGAEAGASIGRRKMDSV